MKRFGKLFFVGVVILLLTVTLALPAFAETEAGGGDLYTFDDSVNVTDGVGGDLLAFAMELTVKGEVQGSIRAFANEMVLNASVGRNVTVAGTTVECGEQFAANDVKIFGSRVVFLGSCDTLSVSGGTVYIGGTVRGSVRCEADQVILLEGADISSAEITSSSEPVVAKSLSDTSYSPLKGSAFEETVKFTQTQSALISDLISLPFTLIVAVVLALAVTFVLKRTSDRVPQQLKARPVAFCLKGLAVLVVIPVAAILLLIPAITWPISVSLLLLYIVLLLLADAIAAVVLSRAWLSRWNPYLSAAFVAAIIAILSILPYVSFLVSLISTTVGFGAVASLLSKRREPIVNVPPEMDFRV